MLALGLDTTGDWCSVALVDAGKILSFHRQEIGRGHAEILGPMVKEVLAKAHIRPEHIQKLIACTGPGSFTGVRVGLAFAKGLALPHNIPVIGISALQVWALDADPEATKTVLAAADVRRGQIFTQMFENAKPMASAQLETADTVNPKADIIVGSGAYLCGGPKMSTYVCPARLAWIGMDVQQDKHPAKPLYHRPPDAKLPGGIEPKQEVS